MQQLGSRLRMLLAECKRSQQDVAREVDLPPATLSNLVTGSMANRKIVNAHLAKICKLLGKSRQEFYAEAADIGRSIKADWNYGIWVGETKTLWYRSVGDGVTPLRPENVVVEVDPDASIEMPYHVERLGLEARRGRSQGLYAFEDNPLLTGISADDWPPDGPQELLGVKLKVGTTPYSTLYGLRNVEPDKKTLKSLRASWHIDDGLRPEIAMGVGVSVAIVSADSMFMFARRYRKTGVRHGELDLGAVEGFSMADIITDRGQQRIDVARVMMRGVYEEYGIQESNIRSLELLGFGCDFQWLQWNFIGLVVVDLPAAKVERRVRSAAPHGKEYTDVWAVPAIPKAAFGWLAEGHGVFWSCGLATLWYSLVRQHGISKTEAAAEAICLDTIEAAIWAAL